MTAAERLAAEREIVAQKFPPGSQFLEVEGWKGWLFDFESELDDPYTMFAYWDGTLYHVKMVWPDPKRAVNVHTAHYFQSGSICLAETIGLPTLEQAYAKSVLFATAWSIYERSGEFVF